MLPLPTRQYSKAFNQPLSFDTSSVTAMSYMFYVRPPRVPPASPPALHAAAPSPHAPAASLSAGRGGVRPAAELRHVQSHEGRFHVYGALRARTQPAASTVGPCLHAACAPCAPTPSRLPVRMSFLPVRYRRPTASHPTSPVHSFLLGRGPPASIKMAARYHRALATVLKSSSVPVKSNSRL